MIVVNQDGSKQVKEKKAKATVQSRITYNVDTPKGQKKGNILLLNLNLPSDLGASSFYLDAINTSM